MSQDAKKLKSWKDEDLIQDKLNISTYSKAVDMEMNRRLKEEIKKFTNESGKNSEKIKNAVDDFNVISSRESQHLIFLTWVMVFLVGFQLVLIILQLLR